MTYMEHTNLTEKDFCLSPDNILFKRQEDGRSSVAFAKDRSDIQALTDNYRMVPAKSAVAILLQARNSREMEIPKENTYIIPGKLIPSGVDSIMSRIMPSSKLVSETDMSRYLSPQAAYPFGELHRSTRYEPGYHISEEHGWDTIGEWEIDSFSEYQIVDSAKESIASDQERLLNVWLECHNIEKRMEKTEKILSLE